MAPPTAEQIRAMQMLGLVSMALWFGARVLPPLRPYGGLIGRLALAFYLIAGLALLLWYFFSS